MDPVHVAHRFRPLATACATSGFCALDVVERQRLRVEQTRIVLRLVASEPAELLLRLERRVVDRFRRRRKYEVELDAGANVVRLPAILRPARYRLRGAAEDAAGNRGSFGPLRFTVRRR